ncbi:MAG: uroporphyrinogen-III C-methyltransferase [Propionibacteriales bacterium]|nr:uroporphyrinogen-III C-methyltransferase [Propionibacteriales bacterium]
MATRTVPVNPSDHPPYPVGLFLSGRRVVVVGGGNVAQRRVPGLLGAGADVLVVSPRVTAALEGLALSGEIRWREGGFRPDDLDDAWYVIASADVREVNDLVSREAERRRIFCVRSDDATQATAWTPAVGRHGDLTVAVLGRRTPRRSAALRDAILDGLYDGRLSVSAVREVTPGVTLVGGGPGDADLVTTAGRRALHEADVVIADRLAPRAVLDELPAHVEVIDAAKLPRGRAAEQEEINRLIVDRVRSGKHVVRFKGGDPFVFGRGFEEALACAEAGVPWRVVPGLTSAISVPAVAGIPVTHRGVAHEFTVVSGHLPPGHPESLVNWPALAALEGTLVLLMAIGNLAEISAELIKHGRPAETSVAVIQDGSMPGEQVLFSRLKSAADDVSRAGLRAPSVVVVGEVVDVARSS